MDEPQGPNAIDSEEIARITGKILMKRETLILLFFLTMVFSGGFTSRAVEGDGPSASGKFRVDLEGAKSQEITFHATLAGNGATSGEITFREVGKPVEPKRAEASNDTEDEAPFFAKATCDCLTVKGIEAALSGVITESSRESYVGRRVLLVVQDGDAITPPLRDKLTFGFYRNTTRGWVATDSERPEEGSSPSWVATDAERPDDPGVTSSNSEQVTCQTFPISSHSFIGKQGKGTIEVHR
jgi:hypothetical protein